MKAFKIFGLNKKGLGDSQTARRRQERCSSLLYLGYIQAYEGAILAHVSTPGNIQAYEGTILAHVSTSGYTQAYERPILDRISSSGYI